MTGLLFNKKYGVYFFVGVIFTFKRHDFCIGFHQTTRTTPIK